MFIKKFLARNFGPAAAAPAAPAPTALTCVFVCALPTKSSHHRNQLKKTLVATKLYSYRQPVGMAISITTPTITYWAGHFCGY